MNKYFNKKCLCNQMHKHDSKREAQRCDELYILARSGLISRLIQQPEFVLQPTFRFKGKAVREIIYRADFSYFDNLKKLFVVEDSKGFKTKEYLLKVKILKFIMKDRKDFLFIES